MNAILMTEEYWRSSQLSVARYYGGIKIDGHAYTIVDRMGKTLLECSIEAEKKGRDMAIAPGEPADLVRDDFIPYYKKLGRKRFIAILEEHSREDEEKLKQIYKQLIETNRNEKVHRNKNCECRTGMEN